jgi:hypothetical protein
MVFFVAALSAIVALASASPVNTRVTLNWSGGQTVQTTSGVVTGHAAKNRTEVSEYLGIPFAKPPIGDLRWKAPVKYTGNGPINASTYVSSRLAQLGRGGADHQVVTVSFTEVAESKFGITTLIKVQGIVLRHFRILVLLLDCRIRMSLASSCSQN